MGVVMGVAVRRMHYLGSLGLLENSTRCWESCNSLGEMKVSNLLQSSPGEPFSSVQLECLSVCVSM